MGDWPGNDFQLVTAVILGLLLVVLIVTALQRARVTRKEFAKLRKDVKQLSDDVKALQVAEQRRFIKELRTAKDDEDIQSSGPKSAASANASPSALPDSQIIASKSESQNTPGFLTL
jgi:cytoskeletal protein RodZ